MWLPIECFHSRDQFTWSVTLFFPRNKGKRLHDNGSSSPRVLVGYTNMAAVLLFRCTNSEHLAALKHKSSLKLTTIKARWHTLTPTRCGQHITHAHNHFTRSIRDGPLEKWWGGGGGGGFSACTNFFFRALLVQEFFFQVKPPARILFLDKYCFF